MFTIYTCPECGCNISADHDSRVVCPDCEGKVICPPTALEFSIDNPPAAGPWQFEEPTDGGQYIFKQVKRSGTVLYHVGVRYNRTDSGEMWISNGLGMIPTNRIVAWAPMNEPQEVPK